MCQYLQLVTNLGYCCDKDTGMDLASIVCAYFEQKVCFTNISDVEYRMPSSVSNILRGEEIDTEDTMSKGSAISETGARDR